MILRNSCLLQAVQIIFCLWWKCFCFCYVLKQIDNCMTSSNSKYLSNKLRIVLLFINFDLLE